MNDKVLPINTVVLGNQRACLIVVEGHLAVCAQRDGRGNIGALFGSGREADGSGIVLTDMAHGALVGGLGGNGFQQFGILIDLGDLQICLGRFKKDKTGMFHDDLPF